MNGTGLRCPRGVSDAGVYDDGRLPFEYDNPMREKGVGFVRLGRPARRSWG